MIFRLCTRTTFAIASMAFSSFAGATNYTTTLFGSNTYAKGINDAGQVVGASILGATTWIAATPTYLPPFAVPPEPYRTPRAFAWAINNSGIIVGNTDPNGSLAISHATMWNGTNAVNLTPLGWAQSSASAINGAGLVAGASLQYTNSKWHATVWNGTSAIDLGAIAGGTSRASDINDAGTAVGYASFDRGSGYYVNHATMWNGTTAIDLGSYSGINGLSDSSALSINNAGQIVGSSLINGGTHATLWYGATATDLGTLGGYYSTATSINNTGQIVGYSMPAGNESWRATIWDGKTATDLNDYLDSDLKAGGWELTFADAINNSGQIIGSASNRLTNESSAFFMTVAAVPETQTYSLMLAGLGFIAGIARRRSKQQKSQTTVLGRNRVTWPSF